MDHRLSGCGPPYDETAVSPNVDAAAEASNIAAQPICVAEHQVQATGAGPVNPGQEQCLMVFAPPIGCEGVLGKIKVEYVSRISAR